MMHHNTNKTTLPFPVPHVYFFLKGGTFLDRLVDGVFNATIHIIALTF